MGGNANWENPNNWVDASGSVIGCIPSIFDDVYVIAQSKGNIRIPSPYEAKCRNFIWTNTAGLDLILEGNTNALSILTVAGDFDLDMTAEIIPVLNHEIIFSSATDNIIQTSGVELPEISFTGNLGQWNLADDLSCDELTFQAGTLNTQNQLVVANNWTSQEDYPKHFDFGNSHIIINGTMGIAPYNVDNVTVDAGTSLIECITLNSTVTDLYDVQLNNPSSLTMENYQYNFNSLILNGVGQVDIQEEMTLNDLVFKAEGSVLALDVTEYFEINGGIKSTTSQVNTGKLKSRTLGTRTDINRPNGNICVDGYVEFTDINAALSGVFNAPDGINGGNNYGVNFDDGLLEMNLYWIGGSGDWEIENNWSRVSGGCTNGEHPNDGLNLIFDDNGLYQQDEVIDVTGINNCGNMFFQNSEESITLNITNELNPANFRVTNGDVDVSGNYINVVGTTTIENLGVIRSDMLNFKTKDLEASLGLIIIRNGSKLSIKP